MHARESPFCNFQNLNPLMGTRGIMILPFSEPKSYKMVIRACPLSTLPLHAGESAILENLGSENGKMVIPARAPPPHHHTQGNHHFGGFRL